MRRHHAAFDVHAARVIAQRDPEAAATTATRVPFSDACVAIWNRDWSTAGIMPEITQRENLRGSRTSIGSVRGPVHRARATVEYDDTTGANCATLQHAIILLASEDAERIRNSDVRA